MSFHFYGNCLPYKTRSGKILLHDQLMLETVMVSEILNFLTELIGIFTQKYFIKLLFYRKYFMEKHVQSSTYTSATFPLVMETSVPSNAGYCTHVASWVLVFC
jgi:hypothetical protein